MLPMALPQGHVAWRCHKVALLGHVIFGVLRIGHAHDVLLCDSWDTFTRLPLHFAPDPIGSGRTRRDRFTIGVSVS